MTAPTELELALLSMDVYEKQEGRLNENGGVGFFQKGNQSLEGSFFAQAYTFSGGVVISYSGSNDGPDWWANLGVIGGDVYSDQHVEAAKFYQELTGGIESRSDFYLTGHSLGGGLAGFVGALYGTRAVIFNNLAFEDVAEGVRNISATTLLDDSIPGNPVYGPIDAIARLKFYQNQEPPGQNGLGQISGTSFAGEGAAFTRVGDWQPTGDVTNYSPGSVADAYKKHSINLLVMTMFGDLQTETSWRSVGNYLYGSLFDDDLATAVSGVSDSEQMRTKIAYTAVEDGAMPFGNVGIRSMFNDLNELGHLQNEGSDNALLTDPEVMKSLVEIAVQFAADTAEQKSEIVEDRQGAISLSTSQGLLLVDLDPGKWVKSSTDDGSNIVGRDNLVDALLSASGADASKWGATAAEVTKIVIATGSDAVNLGALDAPNLKNDSPGAAILVGGEGEDQLWGGLGKDVLIGGGGDDLIRGGDGEDLLVGGAGDDTIIMEIVEASTGEDEGDTIFGGEGADTFVLAAAWAEPMSAIEFVIAANDNGAIFARSNAA